MEKIKFLQWFHIIHSNYIYKLAKLNAIPVFSPFHTAEVEELYMTGVTNIIKTDKFEKIEIEIALKELGLEGLSFNPAGFTVNRVSDQGSLISKKQFNKQILSLINSTYTK